MTVAILGTRGIPARYGGFETFAEELSGRLVALGHSVTVYGRRKFFSGNDSDTEPYFVNGVRIVKTPTIMHKYFETPVHALTSFVSVLKEDFDVLLLCNAANAPFAWILKFKKSKLLINVDGIERHRAKWNRFGKLWYRLGELSAILFADRVVADAQVIADYYNQSYKIIPEVIQYGVNPKPSANAGTLAKFALKTGQYLLYVSRLEPENNALGVINAYTKLKTDLPLVIVGDAPYANRYKQLLIQASKSHNVIFTGFQFADSYCELQANARLYIQATEVGGTHPALIESMSYGNLVFANGTPENIEVLGDAGIIYQKNNFEHLATLLQDALDNRQNEQAFKLRAKERSSKLYSWSAVVERYLSLFEQLSAPKTY